jgi:tRNA(Ile)-lysidine synthase
MRKKADQIIQLVAEVMAPHTWLSPGQTLLVACSGGPDSVFLVYALHQLGHPLALAHVNYGLRGEDATLDEALVRKYAQRWGLPCHVQHAPPPPAGVSVQAYARELRYDFFEQLMDEQGYAACITAHHQDDQVESLLLSLLRSRKPQLWQGIPRQRDRYLRPLLDLPKADILQALADLDLPYRLDASNDETYYLRNRIRHGVIPSLRDIHPQVEAHLLRRHDWYQLQYALVVQVLAPHLPKPGELRLDWQAFVAQHGQPLLPLLVAETLQTWGLHGAELDDTLRLIDSQPGAYRDLPMGRLLREPRGLCLLPLPPVAPEAVEVAAFEGEIRVTVGTRHLDLHLPVPRPAQLAAAEPMYLDADTLQFPLLIRPWQQGDRMQPLGLRGHKKLSDIFVDAHFAPLARQQAIVVADQQGIVALSDFRIDQRVRLRDQTQRIMKLVISAPA